MIPDTEEFLAPRNSFLPPIPDLDTAADLFGRAADAVLSGNLEDGRLLLVEADIPAIGEFSHSIVGPRIRSINRFRNVPDAPPPTNDRAVPRKPGKKLERLIFSRDGWRCRFCGIRVLSTDAIRKLNDLFPAEVRWDVTPFRDRHSGANALDSSIDHILPHSRGGKTDLDNLVLACGSCQYGRHEWTLDEVGFTDPREREPVTDDWDGLTRLLLHSA